MALTIKHSVTLDLSHKSQRVTIPFSRGDKVAHEISFILRYETDYIELSDKTRAYIIVQNGVKSTYKDANGLDKVGTGVVASCVIDYTKQIINWQVAPAALEIAGEIPVILIVTDENGANISSDVFFFSVKETGMVDIENEIDSALKANSAWDLITKIANDADLIKTIEERVMLENLVLTLTVDAGEPLTLGIDSPHSIDWGDGSGREYCNQDGEIPITHVYESAGTYQCVVYGLNEIKADAFYGMTAPRKVHIGNGIYSIGNKAFYNCTELVEVTVSDGVRTIGSEAFASCAKLEKINFGDSINAIEPGALMNTALVHIDLPDSLRRIPINLFSNCPSLTSVSFGKYVAEVNGWSACPNLKSVTFRGVTPPIIASSAFSAVDEILVGREFYESYRLLYSDLAEKIKTFATTAEVTAVQTDLTAHKTDSTAHDDIRRTANTALEKINTFLSGITDKTRDQLFEVLDLITKHEGDVTKALATKVKYDDIVNNLESSDSKLVLSANQGRVLKELIDDLDKGKLSTSELTNAINAALAQAKETGKFDGEKGDPGVDTLVVSEFIDFPSGIAVGKSHQMSVSLVNRVPELNDSLLIIGLYNDDVFKIMSTVTAVSAPSFTYKITDFVKINGRGIKNINFVDDEDATQRKVIIEYTDGTINTDLSIPNGRDGDVPRMRVNPVTNFWEVSYDNGSTWESTETKATGQGVNEYIKTFYKSDFTQIGVLQKYCLTIPQSEHGLINPYVAKAILKVAVCDEDDEPGAAMGSFICKCRVLTTGTVKVYVTVDLSKYTEYTGKIYLEGEGE